MSKKVTLIRGEQYHVKGIDFVKGVSQTVDDDKLCDYLEKVVDTISDKDETVDLPKFKVKNIKVKKVKKVKVPAKAKVVAVKKPAVTKTPVEASKSGDTDVTKVTKPAARTRSVS